MNYILQGQKSERLRFRLLQPEDYDAWLPLFKAKHIAKYLDLDPNLSPSELCKFWFDKAFHRYAHNLGGMNALTHKETNQLVGQAGLLIQTIEEVERLEIGYSILPAYWNQGYASEAAAKCKEYAFQHNFAPSLISMVHEENVGSERVALKNGMSFEKKVKAFNMFSIDKVTWELAKARG